MQSKPAGGPFVACLAAARRSILRSNTGSRPLSHDPLGGEAEGLGKNCDCGSP